MTSNPSTVSDTSKNPKPLPPNYHKIWVQDGVIRYLVGGKKATVRARTEAELEKLKVASTCLVCAAPSNEHHYGARSCSDCSEFFRQSVVDGPEYVCITGGRCRVNYDTLNNTCSACRMRKCIFNGMSVEALKMTIQKKNDKILDHNDRPKFGGSESSVSQKLDRAATSSTLTSSEITSIADVQNAVSEYRKRLVTSSKIMVDSAVKARDNVALDVQLLTNILIGVGHDLVNQIDVHANEQFKKNQENLKQLNELERAMNSSPNSTEARDKLMSFLKKRSSVQECNISYIVSNLTKDKTAVAKLFNVPKLNEVPLPETAQSAQDKEQFPLTSTIASTTTLTTAENQLKLDSNGESGNIQRPVLLTDSEQRSTLPKKSTEAQQYPDKVKRFKPTTNEGFGDSSDAINKSSSIKRKGITNDNSEDESLLSKKPKIPRRIVCSESEKETADEAELGRRKMEKIFQEQEFRKKRKEEKQQMEKSQESPKEDGMLNEVPTRCKECKLAGKSQKSFEKKENVKPLTSTSAAQEENNHVIKPSRKKLHTKIGLFGRKESINTAFSMSHPSLKKCSKKSKEKLPSPSTSKLSEFEQSLLSKHGFNANVKISIMRMNIPEIVQRHKKRLVSTSFLTSNNEAKNITAIESLTKLPTNSACNSVVLHNFISTAVTSQIRAGSENADVTSFNNVSERVRKSTSEQPSHALRNENDQTSATSAQSTKNR